MYNDTTAPQIEEQVQQAWKAFKVYRDYPLKKRADFMRAIAQEIVALGEDLIDTAAKETHLSHQRLRTERDRTVFQLNSYANFCETGDWMDIRIDTAVTAPAPGSPDIRKTMIALGPVVVFGAANFPFAYSTAGGDTACALAAGCPVLVKAHPGHPATSEKVAAAISKVAHQLGLPTGVFSHIYGASFEVGKTLVTHSRVKAVGFTGSFVGGKQLFDWANQRAVPIPVFAEMSSINPVYLLKEKLQQDLDAVVNMYAGSITLDAGQFCTNPGLIIGVRSPALEQFTKDLGAALQKVPAQTMLHPGIFKNYQQKRSAALNQKGVRAVQESISEHEKGWPTLATVRGEDYLKNPLLHQEVFGPYSLIVNCADVDEMNRVAEQMEGQLTTTVMGTEQDLRQHEELLGSIKDRCGRLILNGVPTGVRVCLSMQHGGPFPATTDSRFSSVGGDGIRRFVRPLAYQGWPEAWLPDELKTSNPLKIRRLVNNEWE